MLNEVMSINMYLNYNRFLFVYFFGSGRVLVNGRHLNWQHFQALQNPWVL